MDRRPLMEMFKIKQFELPKAKPKYLFSIIIIFSIFVGLLVYFNKASWRFKYRNSLELESSPILLWKQVDLLSGETSEAIQTHRQKRVADFCQIYQQLDSGDGDIHPELDFGDGDVHPERDSGDGDIHPDKLNWIYVDDNRQQLFCAIPKVACTNWKRVLMVMSGKSPATDPLEISKSAAHVMPRYLPELKLFSAEEIRQKIKTYKKYIFVRHPFDRLLSAFRNKLENPKNVVYQKIIGSKIIRKYRANPEKRALGRGSDVTFEEFVRFIIDQDRWTLDSHWRPYYELCMPCRFKYDFIGYYENFADDVKSALKQMNAENITFPEFDKPRSRTTDLLKSYFGTLSKQQIEQLRKLYYPDFEMFGYEFPKFSSFLDLE